MYKSDIYKHDSTANGHAVWKQRWAHATAQWRTEALRMCSAHAQSVGRVRAARRAAEERARRQHTLDGGIRVRDAPPSLLVLHTNMA